MEDKWQQLIFPKTKAIKLRTKSIIIDLVLLISKIKREALFYPASL